MKTDIAYEISDLRNGDEVPLLGVVGIITRVPGGIEIKSNTMVGLFVDLEADTDDVILQDNGDQVIFNLPEGTVHLEKLRVENYRRRVLPFLDLPQPFYLKDDEVNVAFYVELKEMD